MRDQGDVEEMRSLLRYASNAKVARALGVSRASVSEWSRGNDVSPYRVDQVRALIVESLEHSEAAPPAEASGAVAPEWALQLTKELRDEIIATRSAVVGPLAREVATRAGEELRELLPQLLAALARADEDQ